MLITTRARRPTPSPLASRLIDRCVLRVVDLLTDAEQHAQQAITSYVRAGKELLKVKERVPHGAFLEMLERRLPFSARKAERLMAIARHPTISNSTSVSNLPPRLGALYELARIGAEQLEQAIETGTVNARTTRSEARTVIYAAVRPVVEEAPTVIYAAAPEEVPARPRHVMVEVTPSSRGEVEEIEPPASTYSATRRQVLADLVDLLSDEQIESTIEFVRQFDSLRGREH